MQPMAHLFQGHDDQVAEAVLEALRGYEDPVVRYANLTKAQGIYEELVRRIGAERALVAREMHEDGHSYAQIAGTFGLTRARAQQLVEKAKPVKAAKKTGKQATVNSDDLLSFLADYVRAWPRPAHRSRAYGLTRFDAQQPVVQAHSAGEIAADLMAQAEFRALQLGRLLSTPDGQVLSSVIEALTPPLYREDAELLVEALELAAQTQQQQVRDEALKVAALVTVGGALILAASRSTA